MTDEYTIDPVLVNTIPEHLSLSAFPTIQQEVLLTHPQCQGGLVTAERRGSGTTAQNG